MVCLVVLFMKSDFLFIEMIRMYFGVLVGKIEVKVVMLVFLL